MCSLAPRAAVPGFGATALLDRQRGVAAVAVALSATSGHNAGEPTRRARARASEASTAPARKRGRHDGFEHADVDPAASSALRMRMDKELVALQGLIKKAKFLPRSAPPADKKYAAGPPRSEAPPPVAKRTTSQSKPTAEAANPKQQRAAAKNPIALEVPNKQRPADAPAAAAKDEQHRVQRAVAAKTEEEEEKIARAAARKEFRQMLVDMEKAALYDWRIYPEDLEEFGIPFEFVTTRTWKQACLDWKAELGGV